MNVYIDICNNVTVYHVLCHKLESFGWEISSNALTNNPYWHEKGIPRYFHIDVAHRKLNWDNFDTDESDILRDVIDTAESAVALVEFLQLNIDTLQPVELPPKKKATLYSQMGEYYDQMTKAAKELKIPIMTTNQVASVVNQMKGTLTKKIPNNTDPSYLQDYSKWSKGAGPGAVPPWSWEQVYQQAQVL